MSPSLRKISIWIVRVFIFAYIFYSIVHLNFMVGVQERTNLENDRRINRLEYHIFIHSDKDSAALKNYLLEEYQKKQL